MSYYETLQGVGPGIDISHYGAPYQGMFGVPPLGAYTEQPGEHFREATAGVGMLYRYGLGVAPWTGVPSADPRMVKQFTKVTATFRVKGINQTDKTTTKVADALLAKARALYSGNTVRKAGGGSGWLSGGRVGFEVILAATTRAGDIKQKNFQAGQQTGSSMGVEFTDASTLIPSNAFEDAPPGTPPTPETSPSSTESENPLTRKVAGLPVWALGLIGIGVIGGGAVLLTRKKKAPTPNRRRRPAKRKRRRSTRRRSSRRR